MDRHIIKWIGISLITKLEFLAFSRLSDKDRCLFTSFLHRVNVMGLSETDDALHQSIIQKRRDLGLKLPDAIILATALAQDACLVTDDEGLLKIENPSVMPYPQGPDFLPNSMLNVGRSFSRNPFVEEQLLNVETRPQWCFAALWRSQATMRSTLLVTTHLMVPPIAT